MKVYKLGVIWIIISIIIQPVYTAYSIDNQSERSEHSEISIQTSMEKDLNGYEWISFQLGKEPFTPPSILVLESNTEFCEIEVKILGMAEKKIEKHGTIFRQLRLPNNGITLEVSKPELPSIRGFIEIPKNKNIKATILNYQYFNLTEYIIYPTQSPVPEQEENNDFNFDPQIYFENSLYPEILVDVISPLKLRDHTLAQLVINPIRYNPERKEVIVYESMKIRLEFYEENTRNEHILPISKPFEDICKDLIWNYELRDMSSSSSARSEENENYLIISHDSFYSALESFMQWKTNLGLSVQAVNISQIGITDSDIYNFIYGAYHNWANPPTYVLLVGDVDYVPTHYGLEHPYYGDIDFRRKVATDQYYACVDGEDYLPDILIGRFSIRNSSELNNVIIKVMDYDGISNNKITLVSETGYFESTSNWIFNYLSTKNYICNRLFESIGNVTTSTITDTLENGRAIVNYRGHGIYPPVGWETGPFQNLDVYSLNNDPELIVTSFTCNTGMFDYPNGDCFGEVWLKAPEIGAVAFLGSSRVSYEGFNDELCKGFYKSIWDDGTSNLGAIASKAKIYMLNYYGTVFYAELHFEMYNLLTDPQLAVSSELCLESMENNGDSFNKGMITFDGITHLLPSCINGTSVSHSVTYHSPIGYSFERWEGGGGINFQDENSRSTIVDILSTNSSNELRAIYSLNSSNLGYSTTVSNVVDDGLSWVGFLGLMNAGYDSCVFTFNFYDTSGVDVGTRYATLNSYAHYGKYVRNILGAPFSGTIKVTCDQPFVGSYNHRNPARTMMMSYNFVSDPFPEPSSGYMMLVPHVHDDAVNWIGFLGLMNVGGLSATVTFEFYNDGGVKVGEKTESLNSNAHYGSFISGIQGGYFTGALKITSNQPFIGSFTQRDPTYNVMSGYDFTSKMPAPSSGYVTYVPHVHDDGIGWFGFLGVMNAGGSTATVTFQFYNDDGVLVGNESRTLASYAHYGNFVRNIVGAPFVGSVKILSTQPVVGSLSHRNPSKTVMIAYNIESELLAPASGYEACIPHLHDDGVNWNCYLSLANNGDASSSVTFEFYDDDGFKVDEETVSVGSKAEFSSLVRNILEPDAYFVGSVKIVCNQSFVGCVTHRSPSNTVMMGYNYNSN